MRYTVDNSGTLTSCSEAISGEHHDVWRISEVFEQLCAVLQQAEIAVDGLFMNAAFDCKQLRQYCEQKQIIANIPENPRSSECKASEQYFDELLYVGIVLLNMLWHGWTVARGDYCDLRRKSTLGWR